MGALILAIVCMLTDSRGEPLLNDVSQRGVLEQYDAGTADGGT